MVSVVNIKVVILAVNKEVPLFLNLLDNTGSISRVITAEMVFTSDEVMDMVLANKEAMTRPISPLGKSVCIKGHRIRKDPLFQVK